MVSGPNPFAAHALAVIGKLEDLGMGVRKAAVAALALLPGAEPPPPPPPGAPPPARPEQPA